MYKMMRLILFLTGKENTVSAGKNNPEYRPNFGRHFPNQDSSVQRVTMADIFE